MVITTFNRRDVIARAVESVLAQDYRPIELTVVDDGSTDDTASILKEYGQRIHYIYQENLERAAARNHGIRTSGGDLIGFLDSDDEILGKGHVSALVEALSSNAHAGLAYSQAEFYDDETRQTFDVFPRRPPQGDTFVRSAMGNFMAIGSALIRRSLLDRVGWFDEDEELSGSEDWELWTRCLGATSVVFIPGARVRIHFHSRNTTGDTSAMERAIRCASRKILEHPFNQERLRPHRRRLRAGTWALLAHHQMLAGNRRLALTRLSEGFREDPSVIFQPVWSSMLIKSMAGPQIIGKLRVLRRRAHLLIRERKRAQ